MAVGGDVVEAVVVNAGVRQVLGHVGNDVFAGCRKQVLLAGQIEAKQRVAVLKALRPLRPTSGRVLSADSKYRRAVCRVPAPLELQGFRGCKFQGTIDRRHESLDRKSTRLNSSHLGISYAVFCLKKKKKT